MTVTPGDIVTWWSALYGLECRVDGVEDGWVNVTVLRALGEDVHAYLKNLGPGTKLRVHRSSLTQGETL